MGKFLFYISISSFQLTESLHSKNQTRQSIGNDNCSLLANTNLVSGINGNCDRQSYNHQQKEKITNITSSRPTAFAGYKTYSACMSSIRENFESRGLSETSTNILMSSWKHSTKKQYETFIKKWFVYCSKSTINQFEASLENVLEFLSSFFEKGLGYSSINTVRSAFSALGLKLDSILVGQHPLIIRYLRGVFNLRPCRPEYTCIWDFQLVLNLLRTLSPVKFINLKDISLQLTMLLVLTKCNSNSVSPFDLFEQCTSI